MNEDVIVEEINMAVSRNGSVKLSKNIMKVIKAWKSAGFDVFIEYQMYARPHNTQKNILKTKGDKNAKSI